MIAQITENGRNETLVGCQSNVTKQRMQFGNRFIGARRAQGTLIISTLGVTEESFWSPRLMWWRREYLLFLQQCKQSINQF